MNNIIRKNTFSIICIVIVAIFIGVILIEKHNKRFSNFLIQFIEVCMLLTNDHGSNKNVNIQTGKYRRLNLDKEPFSTLRNKFLFKKVFNFNNIAGKTTFQVTKL
jgi:hypothetical protein